VAHLHALGIEPATHWPQTLPAALRNTRQEEEQALDHWLRMAMSVRQSDVGTMESYLIFHSAAWGGDDNQQMAIIDGPLCAEFSEDERNYFRANALTDALSGDIADRDSERANQLQQRLQQLLAQPLEDTVRIRLLDLYGTCAAYWQDDDQAGLAVYNALFDLSPQAMPGHFAAMFISRAVLANGEQQGLATLTSLLIRAINQPDDAVLVAYAAAAVQYGLYGLPLQPELSRGLMDHAASLMQHSGEDTSAKDLITIAHDMAINDDFDAAHFLMTEMARRGSALHSYELYFFYRNGWHQDVPETFHSDSNAMDCVLSAARSGMVPAMFTCANALREGIGGETDYQQAMQSAGNRRRTPLLLILACELRTGSRP
jgi:TPR repeat protein